MHTPYNAHAQALTPLTGVSKTSALGAEMENYGNVDCAWLHLVSKKLTPLRRMLNAVKFIRHAEVVGMQFDWHLRRNISILRRLEETSETYKRIFVESSGACLVLTPLIHEARILLNGLKDEMIRILLALDNCRGATITTDLEYFHLVNRELINDCCGYDQRTVTIEMTPSSAGITDYYRPRKQHRGNDDHRRLYIADPYALAELYSEIAFDSVWLDADTLQRAISACDCPLRCFITSSEGVALDMFRDDFVCVLCLKLRHLYTNLPDRSERCEHMCRISSKNTGYDVLELHDKFPRSPRSRGRCKRHATSGSEEGTASGGIEEAAVDYWDEISAMTFAGNNRDKHSFHDFERLSDTLNGISNGSVTHTVISECIQDDMRDSLPASFVMSMDMSMFPHKEQNDTGDDASSAVVMMNGIQGVKKATLLRMMTDMMRKYTQSLVKEKSNVDSSLKRDHGVTASAEEDRNVATIPDVDTDKLISGDLYWIDSLSRVAERNANSMSQRRLNKMKADQLRQRINRIRSIIDSLRHMFLPKEWGGLLRRTSFSLIQSIVTRNIFWDSLRRMGYKEIPDSVPCDNSVIGSGTLPMNIQCHSDVIETMYSLSTHDYFSQSDKTTPISNSHYFQIALDSIKATCQFKMNILKILLRHDLSGENDVDEINDFRTMSRLLKSPENMFWKQPAPYTLPPRGGGGGRHVNNDEMFLCYLKYIRELVFCVFMYNCNETGDKKQQANLEIRRVDKLDTHTLIGPFPDGSFEYNLRPGVYLTMGEPPLVLVTSSDIYTCSDVLRMLHQHKICHR